MEHTPPRKGKNIYQVYFVDVLRHAPPFKFTIRVVRRDGRMEGAATGHVKVWVGQQGRPSGLYVQLASELFVLAEQFRVFLFELADA